MILTAIGSGGEFLICSYVLVSAVVRNVDAGSCHHNWKLTGKGNCYFFSNDTKSWVEARDYCQSYNGHLVQIDTEEENTFLQKNLEAKIDYWIGLNDKADENTWVWTRNNTLLSEGDYTNWSKDEPNNVVKDDDTKNGEDCGSFFRSDLGRWNDISCDSSVRYICEGHPLKDVQYTIRIKGAPPKGNVNLYGSWKRKIKLPVNEMESKSDLRVGEITSNNIGNIHVSEIQKTRFIFKVTRIRYNASYTGRPEFVSIHKSDNDGFYIERFGKNAETSGETQSPCVRHFGNALKLILSNRRGLKTPKGFEADDETDCKLRCIESDKFDCRMAYYSTTYRHCHIIGQADISNHFTKTNIIDVFLFQRTDNC